MSVCLVRSKNVFVCFFFPTRPGDFKTFFFFSLLGMSPTSRSAFHSSRLAFSSPPRLRRGVVSALPAPCLTRPWFTPVDSRIPCPASQAQGPFYFCRQSCVLCHLRVTTRLFPCDRVRGFFFFFSREASVSFFARFVRRRARSARCATGRFATCRGET